MHLMLVIMVILNLRWFKGFSFNAVAVSMNEVFRVGLFVKV